MTAVDRPDNGQNEGREPVASDRDRAVAEGLLARLYEGMSDDDMLAYVAGALAAERTYALASGRAGAGEQQREKIVGLLCRFDWGTNRPNSEWRPVYERRADELLALLGGPQPDGEGADAVEAARACWCAHCEGIVLAADHPTNPVARIGGRRFIVCRDCGDKRCPRAAHHDAPCAYREPCPVYSHGESGWHCAVTGDHDQHTNAARDETW